MDLTNEDVADVLALLDSLPYDELDLQTTRFRLTLRRTPDGWTQSTQVLSEPHPLEPAQSPTPDPPATTPMTQRGGYNDTVGPSVSLDARTDGADGTNGDIEDHGEAGAGRGEAKAGPGETGGESTTVGGKVGEAGGAEVADGAEADGAEADGAEADGAEADGAEADGELVAVRAPLPGTFYRAPRPGAPPFVEVGSRVSAETVVGIVETMKLMNSVSAGVGGTVAEICLGNAEFAPHGATLVRIRADP